MKIKANDKLKVRQSSSNFDKGAIVYALADETIEGCVPVARTLGGEYIGACGPSGSGWFAHRFEIMAPAIDFAKPLETTEGEPVTVLTTSARGAYPVLAYLGNSESVSHFTAEGKYYTGTTRAHDLRNVVPEKVVYINVYADGSIGGLFKSRERADANAFSSKTRVSCVRVVLPVGQFDA